MTHTDAGELLPCLHPNLHFGSGDYHLFCHDCNQTWTVTDHAKANRGAATQLSGQVRQAASQGSAGGEAVREALERLRETNAAEYLRVVAQDTTHYFDKGELPKIAKLIDAALDAAVKTGGEAETSLQNPQTSPALPKLTAAGETACCKGLAPSRECRCEIERKAAGHPPYQRSADLAQARGNYEDRHPNDMVLHPLSEIREWDEALQVLGIQDSDQTPADAIRERDAEIERLRACAQAAPDSLRAAAERVCWFDWSDNDMDACAAMDALRKALTVPSADREADHG